MHRVIQRGKTGYVCFFLFQQPKSAAKVKLQMGRGIVVLSCTLKETKGKKFFQSLFVCFKKNKKVKLMQAPPTDSRTMPAG